MNIKLVSLKASHLTEFLRGRDNTGWLGRGYCVQQRKGRERVREYQRWRKRRSRRERHRSVEGSCIVSPHFSPLHYVWAPPPHLFCMVIIFQPKGSCRQRQPVRQGPLHQPAIALFICARAAGWIPQIRRDSGASQCHPVHCGRQLQPLGLAPGKLRQRVAQGQNGILVLGDTCVGVIVRCVMYSEMGPRFSNCPRLCKSTVQGSL